MDCESKAAKLRAEFRARFGAEPRIFRAPGRVNLIGEHTDYNDGFVMPAAIDFACFAAVAPRSDGRAQVYSRNLDEAWEFDLNDASARPRRQWPDYVQGVAVVLAKEGLRLGGANLFVDSDVPIGAGLSSSAALEVSVACALLANSGLRLEPLRVAQLCQRAENEFTGMRCGIMDQFTACFGERGNALMLDCRTLAYQRLPIPPGVVLVVANTMVKHELAAGEYNRRREDCEAGARSFGVAALRDVTEDEFARRAQELPERIRMRCRHVISENARVERAAEALLRHDCEEFGRLMDASHRSLRDDYEVSCSELDLMVELARQVPGVYGARMTGGGFGGCTVNLVREEAVAQLRETLAAKYREAAAISPDVYVCHPTQGAGEMETA